MSVFDTLQERGIIKQASDFNAARELLANETVTFYSGFDPTADSLTAGHFVPLMAMAHLQRAGHKPIALIGGGTAFVGDTTDRSDMRPMMSRETIEYNVACIKKQLAKFLDFESPDNGAIMVDNADWLLQLQYIPFIREYGVHFSVNKMLTADVYRRRFETGLTFFEFNYQIMQAYDYLELFRRYGCKLQIGGDDQWSNILAGVDLIRRATRESVECLTIRLLLTSGGKKMGKTQAGAVWLDPNKTSPHEFYQYWRNVDDADVIETLKLLTFVPMNEINDMSMLTGSELNKAKELLAFEVTKLVHGQSEAIAAQETARSLFGGGVGDSSIPATTIGQWELNGMNIIGLLERAKLIASRGEGRRLIQQGGLRVNDVKVDSHELLITPDHFINGKLLIQKGKKVFHKVVIE
ncbi:MAG: tyrosine--tRNA ligase [Clostridiales bacterium]|nr:tyrosine--tRNA ligase [Clostridiales bacterium]